MKTRIKILITLLFFQILLLGCATSHFPKTEKRDPAQAEELLSDISLGTKIVFNRDIKTNSQYEFAAFTESGETTFEERQGLFASNKKIVEAAQKLKSKDLSVICALGFWPDKEKEGGFVIKEGEELEVQYSKIESASAGSWSSPKELIIFKLSDTYLMKCATLYRWNKDETYAPTQKEVEGQLRSWMAIKAVEPIKISISGTPEAPKYIRFFNDIQFKGKKRSVGIKKSQAVDMEEIFHDSKKCWLTMKTPRDGFIKAGEFIEITNVHQDSKNRVTVFESEHANLYCQKLTIMIYSALSYKHIAKITKGFLEIVGIEEIKY